MADFQQVTVCCDTGGKIITRLKKNAYSELIKTLDKDTR